MKRTIFSFVIGASVGALIGLFLERKDNHEESSEDFWWTPENASQSLSDPFEDGLYSEEEYVPEPVESGGIEMDLDGYAEIDKKLEPHFNARWNGRQIVVSKNDLNDKAMGDMAPVEETWLDEMTENDPDYLEIQKLLATVPVEELILLKANQTPRQAWNQYVAMKLSDLNDGWIYDAMFALFKIQFKPVNPEKGFPKRFRCGQVVDTSKDSIVFDNLLQEREEFFGNNFLDEEPIKFAELILYFANLMNFDFGGEVEDYVEEMLNNALIDNEIGYQAMTDICESIQNHVPIGRDTDDLAGLFAVPNWVIEGETTSFLDQYYQFHEFLDDDE